MENKQLVYQIVVFNWLDLSQKECKKKQNQFFLNYMNENCSNRDIISLFSESTQDGVFEMLHHLGDHLMTCQFEDTRFPPIQSFSATSSPSELKNNSSPSSVTPTSSSNKSSSFV
jgi:hypothetical protein